MTKAQLRSGWVLLALLLAPLPASANLLRSKQVQRGTETYYLLAFGPKQPGAARGGQGMERSALRQGIEGLISAYQANDVIGEQDSEMKAALRRAAKETNALSLIVFRRKQHNGRPRVGQMVAMLRAYLPDGSGALALEQKVDGLADALTRAGEQHKHKVEMGNLFINKSEGRWLWNFTIQEARALLHDRIDRKTVVLAQTSKGAREGLYRIFFRFKTMFEYTDPLITKRTSVVMKTSGSNLLSRLGSIAKQNDPQLRTKTLSTFRTQRLLGVQPRFKARRRSRRPL